MLKLNAAAEPSEVEDATRAFQRYDSRGAGALGWQDVKRMLDDANYEASDSYVDKMFSLWDKDGSGGIEPPEFNEIWTTLQLKSVRARLITPGIGAAKSDPVVSAFDLFNRNGDGMLDQEEVGLIMERANYDVDQSYVQGLAESFGTYDADGSGGIELPEFRQMWEKLDLGQLLGTSNGGPATPQPSAAESWAESPAGDEVAAAFSRYNRNGDGMLDLSEIRVLLEDANYDVDDDYVDGIASMFGRWDADGSGGVELPEFRRLWADLNLGSLVQEAGILRADSRMGPATPQPSAAESWAESPAGDEVAAAFSRYNRNGDGMLDLSEIRVLLEDANYDVDDDYVDGIASMFGRWDADGSGGVELPEFRRLWADLNLGSLVQEAGQVQPRVGRANGSDTPVSDEVAAAFDRFNLNGDGMLDTSEIQRLLDTANYEVDSNYVEGLAQLLGEFDADGSGGIELQEFQVLWDTLDLQPRLAAADRNLRLAFDKYNTNGDGMLDRSEIAAMLKSVNYRFDANYVEGLSQLFGKFDVDGSGGIEFMEFRDMWDQLGLGKYIGTIAEKTEGSSQLSQGEQRRRAVTSLQAAERGRQARSKMAASAEAKKADRLSQGEQRRRAVTSLQAAERGRQARSKMAASAEAKKADRLSQGEQRRRAVTSLQAAERGRQARSKMAASAEAKKADRRTAPPMLKNQPVEADRLRMIFARADLNSDGILTRSELIHRLRKDTELALLLQLPQHIGDGNRNAFEAAFQAMDQNDDRSVTAEEFVTYMMSFMQREATSTRQSPPQAEHVPAREAPEAYRGRPSQMQMQMQVRGSPQPPSADIGATVSVLEKRQVLSRLAQIRREHNDDDRIASTNAPVLRTDLGLTAASTTTGTADVLIQDLGSAHDGKVGKFVCNTPSGRFALVQFPGERNPRPVPVSSCKHGIQPHDCQQHQEQPSAVEHGPKLLVDEPMLANNSSTSTASGYVRQYHGARSSVQPLQPGNTVFVTDPSSTRCGECGDVVAITPSGSFVTVKFADAGTPRSFNRSHVVLQPTTRRQELGRSRSTFSRTL